MNLTVLLVAWGLVLLALAAVTAVRHNAAKREDDHLHFSDSDQQLVAVQATAAHRLDVLDRWKTGLIILAVVSGLLILAYHAYTVWEQGARTIPG
jgi:hypothetical protein